MEALQEADEACLASQFCTELGPAQPQLVFQFISVQVLHKWIRGGGRVKVAAYMLTREGG